MCENGYYFFFKKVVQIGKREMKEWQLEGNEGCSGYFSFNRRSLGMVLVRRRDFMWYCFGRRFQVGGFYCFYYKNSLYVSFVLFFGLGLNKYGIQRFKILNCLFKDYIFKFF